MKNEGVTILQIVITVVIMLIILAVSIFLGPNVAREAKIAAIYNEIKVIEEVLKELYVLNDISVDGDSVVFNDETKAPKVNSSNYSNELGADATGDYYYMDFTSSRNLENALGLERVENDYILDLKNLNVYLIGGVDTVDANGKVVMKYNSDEIAHYYDETFVK